MDKKITTDVCPQSKNYPITICSNFSSNIETYFQKYGSKKALIVTTPFIFEHYRKVITDISRQFSSSFVHVMPMTEESKNLAAVQQLCTLAYEQKLGRADVFVALCGGCCQDVVTSAAAIYKRGVGVIRVPTTLIGVIDAGVGIKSSLNLGKLKSAIGTYHPPLEVLIDLNFIKTLPVNFVASGIAEIIKIGLINDTELFELIENNCDELLFSNFFNSNMKSSKIIAYRAIVGMVSQLELNFYEDKTYERLVDFGHTFSNALEPNSNWEIPHGYAVGIDMALSSYIAHRMSRLTEANLLRVLNLLMKLRIPITSEFITEEVCKQAINSAKLHRGGDINLVLPHEIGRGFFIKNDTPELYQIIREGLIFLRKINEGFKFKLKNSENETAYELV